MKETDDGKTIDGQDAGAVPAASTTWGRDSFDRARKTVKRYIKLLNANNDVYEYKLAA